jgi:hypothetical protein
MGLPPSTAYYHIDVYLTTTKYPHYIQEAAAAAGLNLALDHVVAKWDELKAGYPEKPSPLEVKGIIADLEAAKRPQEDAEPITEEKLFKGLFSAGFFGQ